MTFSSSPAGSLSAAPLTFVLGFVAVLHVQRQEEHPTNNNQWRWREKIIADETATSVRWDEHEEACRQAQECG
jgi:hypothetical protein